MTIGLWLGSAAPLRSVRWLDGALAATAALGGGATAIVAGDGNWLDLAADRATRAGLASAGIATDLRLDYLGWAQIASAAARKLGVTTVLVDEASRPERFAEVAAIAEQLDAVQLTRVIAIAEDGDMLRATRVAGSELQTVRVRRPAVIGLRIAGPLVEDYPTPMPAVAMKRFDLPALGLDPLVLVHRALPPRGAVHAKNTIGQVGDHIAFHLAARRR